MDGPPPPPTPPPGSRPGARPGTTPKPGPGFFSSNFRKFFVRGLAVVLPTVLTIWILVAAYQFVSFRIAQPINHGVRELILQATGFPLVSEQEVQDYREEVQAPGSELRSDFRQVQSNNNPQATHAWLYQSLRRRKLDNFWDSYSIVLNTIGLIIAIALIYVAGVVLGSFIGRRLHKKGEDLLQRLPLIRNIYPSVKQVTDFFFGSERERIQFNRVVAVQYPRKGLWSVGLVTGDTMQTIQDAAGTVCLTVFIPSSPTPFTGYVITVPRDEAIDLPITIEEALKFAVSGGVLIPPGQKITRDPSRRAKLQDDAPAGRPGPDGPAEIGAGVVDAGGVDRTEH